MYNLFKKIFGIPTDRNDSGFEDEGNNLRNTYWKEEGGNQNDEGGNDIMEVHSDENITFFGIPIFSNTFEINKYFEQLRDEMRKTTEIFGLPFESVFFSDNESIDFPGMTTDSPPPEESAQSLRDFYLKPNQSNQRNDIKEDVDLDGKVTVDDVDKYLQGSNIMPKGSFPEINLFHGNFHRKFDDHDGDGGLELPGTSQDFHFFTRPTTKFYSKSVYIKSVIGPDGKIQTIKKIRDSDGNEETIIQDN